MIGVLLNRIADNLEELFDLHRMRWAHRGESGVLADTQIQQFHRAAGPKMAEHGMARVYRLCIGAKTVAAIYCLLDRSRVYSYIGGFDPDLSRYSPGSLLIRHAIRRALEDGQAEYDFLRGGEAYKERWGATPRGNRRIVID